MKHIPLIVVVLLCSFIRLPADFYFKDSDHELEVIRIQGDEPGLTMLIFGGIHGDEPGGYFSSELIAGIKLKKGTLILVPRVNFPGIMTNRREMYGDMNRKFLDKEYPKDPDYKVIRVLKRLMAESDIFINQHDAWGFHRKRYISKLYNPFRYGQSLIVDTGKFFSHRFKKELDLVQLGNRIVDRVNKQIADPKHYFCFWNHNSVDPNTTFMDMQKSATHYALTRYSIPSFGLETSKNLPTLEYKIQHQALMIKEILVEFGFEFTMPSLKFTHPHLYWVELLKNKQHIIRVNSNTNVRLKPGDKIQLIGIYSNYTSGLSANILNWGSLNDINSELTYTKPCRVVLKKNQFTIGSINLKSYLPHSIRQINLEIDGKIQSIPNWGKISLGRKQELKILHAQPNKGNFRFDVRGFSLVPGKRDDSGVLITHDDLIPKYSFKGEGNIFFVRIYRQKNLSGGFQIEISKH